MHTTVQIAVIAATFVQTTSGFSTYTALIPNGESIGKKLGHKEAGYTDFGTLFSGEGKTWKKVCTQTWPGGSVTCGEALGDPCCTWTSGDPDFKLTEPNPEGTKCKSKESTSATEAATPAAKEGAPATEETTPSAEKAAPADAAEKGTDETAEKTSDTPETTGGGDKAEESVVQSDDNSTETTAVTDSSDYCE